MVEVGLLAAEAALPCRSPVEPVRQRRSGAKYEEKDGGREREFRRGLLRRWRTPVGPKCRLGRQAVVPDLPWFVDLD